MADHSKPGLSDLYSQWPTLLDGRFDDLACGLDPAVVAPTNLPVDAIRWSSASNKWQKWDGTSWVDLAATFAISISGNAGTATALQNARTINGTSFNGTANITITANTPQALTFNNGGAGAASGTSFNGGAAVAVSYNTIGAAAAGGSNATGTWPIAVTGNAGTATALQTPRAINGTNFDGSAAITTANWGAARTLTIGSTDKSVDGSAAVSWSLAEIGAQATLVSGTNIKTVNGQSILGAGNAGITQGTRVTLSGGVVDVTGIPSTAKRITIALRDMSVTTGDNVLVQLGRSAGVETSGYLSTTSFVTSSVGAALFTDGFAVTNANSAASIYHGVITLVLMDASANLWAAHGVFSRSDTAVTYTVAGTKALGGALERIRLGAVGASTFDGGSMTVTYEA